MKNIHHYPDREGVKKWRVCVKSFGVGYYRYCQSIEEARQVREELKALHPKAPYRAVRGVRMRQKHEHLPKPTSPGNTLKVPCGDIVEAVEERCKPGFRCQLYRECLTLTENKGWRGWREK